MLIEADFKSLFASKTIAINQFYLVFKFKQAIFQDFITLFISTLQCSLLLLQSKITLPNLIMSATFAYLKKKHKQPLATGRKKARRKLTLMIFLMSVGSLILHLAVSENYELHRNAYLYINYSFHPAWGYISVPPFIMVISTIALKVFGGSAFAFRFLPALAGAITTGYVGILTKDLGGNRWAVLIATLTYALSPAFLGAASRFQPQAFDQMFWFIFFYLLVQMLKSKNLNYWYLIAFVTGLGMFNKYSMIIPLGVIVLSLLVSQRFSTLFCRQFWIGLFSIFIMALPNGIWQHNHHWPMFYQLSELERIPLLNFDPINFTNAQFLMNSHGIVIWLLGLIAMLLYRPFKIYRPVAVAFLLMWAILLSVGAKPYYMLGMYPVLFVFGGLIIVFKTQKMEWVRPVITSAIAIIALFILPLSMPFFRVHNMVAYSNMLKKMGIVSPFKWDDNNTHNIPQDFADMRGWNDWSELVKEAYFSLSAEEQEKAVVFGDDYGRVGSYNYYTRKENVPHGYSIAGDFIFWIPDEVPKDFVLIYLDKPPEEISEMFKLVEKYGTLHVENSVVNNAEIYILRHPSSEFYSFYASRRKELLQPFFRKQI